MSTMYLLNSAVITNFGAFYYTPLTLNDATFLLQNRAANSAIGYQETADLLSTLTGASIPVNRQQVTMQPDDTAIVFRLTFRADPGKKGEYTPDFIAANSELGFLRMTQPSEIVQLALRIAKHQRNEDFVQPLTTLIDKYEKEKIELATASKKWDELPDVYYYATVAYEVYGWFPLIADLQDIEMAYNISGVQMRKACIAKYRRRAVGKPKDVKAERAAILAAIAE